MREDVVCIVASPSRILYIGVTNDLERRMDEHKHKRMKRFTARYGVDRLVHMESFANIDDAIARERQLKGWRRARKIALVEAGNPRWHDLSHNWLH